MTGDNGPESDTDEKSMSRRSVLSAGGVVAGGWLVNKLTGGAVSVAKAQQSQECRIEFAPDDVTEWAIDDEVQGDGTTDLIIKHVPSDTTVRWDRSEGEFDFSEIPSFIVDSMTADSVTVNNDITADSLSANKISNDTNFVWLGDGGRSIKLVDGFAPGSANLGWISVLQINHDGGADGSVTLKIDYSADDIGGGESAQVDTTHTSVNNGSDWGTAGSSESIGTDVRWKIDDNDATVAYIQVNLDSWDFGFVSMAGQTYGASFEPIALSY